MSKPAVKICGIRTEAAIETLKLLPVDYVGFVFAKSRRQITPERAAELSSLLKDGQLGERDEERPQTVGVFVNPKEAELAQAVETAQLDCVQLHGSETADLCRRVKDEYGVRVIKVMSVAGSADAEALCNAFAPYVGAADIFMLDTHDPINGGGTGRTFRWDILPDVKAWAEAHRQPLFVAGGVNESNVRELIERYAPDGVDVSSGVETDGHKDPNKIENFVKRVKS